MMFCFLDGVLLCKQLLSLPGLPRQDLPGLQHRILADLLRQAPAGCSI